MYVYIVYFYYFLFFYLLIVLYGSLLVLPFLENTMTIIALCILALYCLAVIIFEAIIQINEIQSLHDVIFPETCAIGKFESMRRRKPKFQTICDVYKKRFFVFKRKINREIKTFEIENWINEMDNFIPDNSDQFIFKTKFEVKFDDEETKQAYKEYPQQLEQWLAQRYRNKNLTITYEHKILFGNDTIPTYVRKDGATKSSSFLDNAFLCIILSFPIIPFVFKLLKNKLPEQWNTIYWFYLSKHRINFVTRISNKNVTVIS